MSKYELVCVIDAGLTTADIKTTQESIEKAVGKKNILDTDQMGLLPLAYPLRGNDQGYFLSYQISIEPSEMQELKTHLSLEKGVAKSVFYKMGENEQFLKFADLQQKFETMRPQEPVKETKEEKEKRLEDKKDWAKDEAPVEIKEEETTLE